MHIVIERHRNKVEQNVGLLKGEATKQLKLKCMHPLIAFQKEDGSIPSPWARGCWRRYLETDQQIEDAMNYVMENPKREGKPEQKWSFVKGFPGLDFGVVSHS